ncbi:MAG TPA: Tim44 domain-containing protein [Nitrospinota bacterium]|nr:Tim44 domain-containing protein [Nitrospinota bacterium]HJP13879.1 Tim44 domain-containing protein [Nitrospinota bacterium]
MPRIIKIVLCAFFLFAPAHINLPGSGPDGVRWATDNAEARFGRMRSFGFRGSRGMFRSRRSFGGFSRRRSYGSSRSRLGSRTLGFRRSSLFGGGFGGFGGGFMGGMAGMFLGGMVGRMLFGGMGYGGGYGGGGGIGLLEIILIGGGIFLLMRYLRNRQAPAYSGNYGGSSHSGGDPYGVEGSYDRSESPGGVYRGPDIGSGYGRGSGPVAATYAADSRAEEGLPGIKSSDGSFSRENFLLDVRETFMRFQDAWVARDLSPMRDLLDSDIYDQCQRDLDKLKSKGRVNKLENLEILRLEIAENWQEEGHDFITVTYEASLLDYVVSESSGEVLEGNPSEPVRFTEHWTWVRPSGPGRWFLSAISQA